MHVLRNETYLRTEEVFIVLAPSKGAVQVEELAVRDFLIIRYCFDLFFLLHLFLYGYTTSMWRDACSITIATVAHAHSNRTRAHSPSRRRCCSAVFFLHRFMRMELTMVRWYRSTSRIRQKIPPSWLSYCTLLESHATVLVHIYG